MRRTVSRAFPSFVARGTPDDECVSPPVCTCARSIDEKSRRRTKTASFVSRAGPLVVFAVIAGEKKHVRIAVNSIRPFSLGFLVRSASPRTRVGTRKSRTGCAFFFVRVFSVSRRRYYQLVRTHVLLPRARTYGIAPSESVKVRETFAQTLLGPVAPPYCFTRKRRDTRSARGGGGKSSDANSAASSAALVRNT